VKDWREFSTQVQEFKKLGRAAYLEEEAREKKGDCPEARSTYEINICLGKRPARQRQITKPTLTPCAP
jgi:hypothetical protein